MCGSNDVVKQDGLYGCQNCDTKYTVEKAMKMTIERNNLHGSVVAGALLFLAVMMMPGMILAQDYTGIYYIANAIWNGDNTGSEYYWYNVNTPEYNWYLVPGADPHLTHYSDAYFNNQYSNTNSGGNDDYTGSNYGDPGKPFLTTYRTNRDNNSIWIVKKTGDDYYIIHALTGKYVKYERTYKSFPARKTMHLEDVEGDNPGNDFKYEITNNTNTAQSITGFNIKVKSLTSGNQHFNPAGDNHPRYYGTNDGNKTPYSSGMVGIWTANADMIKGCLWPYEDASATLTPIITDNGDHTVTISMPTGYDFFDVYYTTDGSTPDASSAHATGSVTISDLPADYYGWIKAKAGRVGVLTTTTASLYVDFNTIAQPTMSISGCDNSIALSCTSPETSIYYTMDGSDPTETSTLYTGPFYVADGTTLKFIAYRYTNHSTVATQTVVYTYTALPTITFSMATLECVLACPDNTATIFYTYTTDNTEPSDPNPNDPSQAYSDPIDIPQNTTFWIKAIAKNSSLLASCVVENSVSLDNVINDLAGLQNITGNNHYLVVADISASGLQSSIADFSGTLESLVKEDGTFCTISGLNKPLFASTNDATIRNLTFDNVNITSGTNVGTLVAEADGATHIYNVGVLGGSVSGSGNVGGLVGQINSGSSVRVVNCYNYADVSGGTYAAGIVGKNEGTVGNVRIALCMMYGNVASATNISPVYGGNHVNNVQNFPEYNYWRYRSGMQYTAYNDQMAIDKDDYLTRFPFYRHILNTHRELAAYFLFAANTTQGSVADITPSQVAEIGHWALKKDIAPYPIIEQWEENTKKVLEAPTPSNILTEMGASGYLNVSVSIDGHSYSARLPITDMDEDNYDFTWGKVVLPFANEFEVNTDYSKICTGWKITNVSPATEVAFEHYNVSDRNCTAKDLYNTTGFIFAQGGNYIVPYGVTAITIEANFATAYYLCDESYEIGYSGDGSEAGYTGRIGLGGSMPTSYHSQPVYNTLPAALNAMSNDNTTHTQAVVLVGNYHMDNDDLSSSNRSKNGFTIMSIDADNNQEPDYAIYSNNTQNRPAIPPMRYDFVAFIPMGMSSHVNGAKFYPNTPIWKPRGWFEITETGLMRADQFELESNNFNESNTNNCRCIINGGYFTQMVRGKDGDCNKLSYYQIGGKAYIKEFYPGSHSASSRWAKLVPVNVTGGEIEQCFMTGYGLGKAHGPNIYFWCAGGRIHKFLGAYMEPAFESTSHTSSNPGTVNMTAKIDHAIISRFFGGGTSPTAPITGDINVTIDNSVVDFYCGGPEFGDMSEGKTVTTTAKNTTFGEYYGAGFGGTAITYRNDKDDGNVTLNATVTYPSSYFGYYTGNTGRLHYVADYGGIGSCYKFEFLMHSRGHRGVARFYTGFASFSLATTGSVTNVLNNCTISNSFYGAGCQGMVNGTVTSTLTNCTVQGSAFGGGYKATANEVDVYPTTMPTLSVFTAETGIFSDFGSVAPDTYTWEQGDETTQNTVSGTTLYTSKDITMNDLGNVTGAITLTLGGHTVVQENVFGGGNESKSLNNATVTVKGNSTVGTQNNSTTGNVFGGGNKAEVSGNTTVKLQGNAQILNNVYGGGNEGVVGGNAEVIIQDE